VGSSIVRYSVFAVACCCRWCKAFVANCHLKCCFGKEANIFVLGYSDEL
jgi:hypothetical protein